LLEPIFRTKTAVFWTRTLDEAGVPNEVPVDTKGGELPLFDADNVALGMVAEYEHRVMGNVRQFGELLRFSETRATIERAAPLVGEHTRSILRDLGCTNEEIDALIADGVCYEPDERYHERFAN
jgi:crotonobetainyl-CoA:carnitine CoA-transferase CaiB-like acyl-CoA transferase